MEQKIQVLAGSHI
uniref:Uncharacterized protein n=1 Tax=Nymphaea colorata TaxID=210225 RepID=A0A5K1DXR0_9MAGN